MAGTIVITGANGSIASHTVQHLLTKALGHTLILAVRNTSDSDPNTRRLRQILSQFPDSKASIRSLDLSILKNVHGFADAIAAEVDEGKLPPLVAVICNAFHWNMVAGPEVTEDGFEKTFQINHISHSALVLRLLGSFGSGGGRVVLFTSDGHYPGRNSLEKYPPGLPDDMDELVEAGPVINQQGSGFQRYANSKLAILMWTYALNRYLEKHETLGKVTAVVIDPGNITDSRALRTNTPVMLSYIQTLILQPLQPVLRFMAPDMRRSVDAGTDVADIALNQEHPDERGYFRLMVPGPSSVESLDEVKQEKLWKRTAEWARISGGDIALEVTS